MSALPQHVALVSQSTTISFSEITSVAAAFNKQVIRDFGPIWNITGTVDPFDSMDQVPVDYWPVVILDKLDDPNAGGYHQTENGEPFSVVLASDFPIAASHETLEMLVDPFGRKTVAGSPPPDSPAPVKSFKRVKYLVEVCDPCEDDQFSYTINGITVSDFITPHYYDPVTSAGVRYSFTGAVKHPHQVLDGGYVSFSDPTSGRWYQIFVENGKATVNELSATDFRSLPIRQATDEAARKYRMKQKPRKHDKKSAPAAAAMSGRAERVQKAIKSL